MNTLTGMIRDLNKSEIIADNGEDIATTSGEVITALKRLQYYEELEEGRKWIPCSERLPEKEYEVVLVWLSSNGYDIAVWCEEYGFRPWYAIYFDECTPEWKHGVIAWQPLPEPYKAGEQE